MSEGIVLFGAGSAGKYILEVDGNGVVAFADNDATKWGHTIKGIPIHSPFEAHILHGDATWVASAISRPAAPEIRAQLKEMGVKTKPLYEILPVCHGIPSNNVRYSLSRLANDIGTANELRGQILFRATPRYDQQSDPSPIGELYFPPFIQHLDGEHFVDCGACDGDTVAAFMNEWNKWSLITAFEPDPENYAKLREKNFSEWVDTQWSAVGDADCLVKFSANGDYSSKVVQDGVYRVPQKRLDGFSFRIPPTYIKMDIEGAELEALWGARRTLQKHMPVLAICAYHTSEHLWQIPLLIHALQPEYKLFLRRYAEGAFELVWYAVPPERLK